MKCNTRGNPAPLAAAFTLVELLVVIAIFVLLLAIAVPAFSSMLYSSEQSLADNHLRMGLGAARDAAIRSPQGSDSAAVFFYDPSTGHTIILPCVSVGTVKDGNPDPSAPASSLVDREVFVAAPGFEPVQLPKGWSVRGYAAPGTIDDTWYGDNRANNLYASNAARQRGNWLFPETGFYDEDALQNDDGQDRQTFMVRFEGGTGVVKSWDQTPVLVLSVNPSTVSRLTLPWNYTDPSTNEKPFRVDLEPDPAKFVRRVTNWPLSGPLQNPSGRQALLGDVCGDTVLAKPVGQLALCNEKRLAQALGVRLDPTSNCLYQDVNAMAPANREPTFVVSSSPRDPGRKLPETINDWVEDHLYISPATNPAPGGPPDDTRTPSDCRIYTIHRYLGTLQEISGTTWGQGVAQ